MIAFAKYSTQISIVFKFSQSLHKADFSHNSSLLSTSLWFQNVESWKISNKFSNKSFHLVDKVLQTKNSMFCSWWTFPNLREAKIHIKVVFNIIMLCEKQFYSAVYFCLLSVYLNSYFQFSLGTTILSAHNFFLLNSFKVPESKIKKNYVSHNKNCIYYSCDTF